MIRSDVIILPPPISLSLNVREAVHSYAFTNAASITPLWAYADVAIVSSTDATPIVLTVASGNKIVAGDKITVVGHTTNVAANGNWTAGTCTDTTIGLVGSVGSGAGAGGATGTINYTDPLILLPETKVWLSFECLTAGCYVRIGPTTQTAATTANNGFLIKASATSGLGEAAHPRFYLTPSKHKYVDILGVSSGTLKWYINSPPCERERI